MDTDTIKRMRLSFFITYHRCQFLMDLCDHSMRPALRNMVDAEYVTCCAIGQQLHDRYFMQFGEPPPHSWLIPGADEN